MTAYHLVHQNTGARHLHLDCADLNNAFMLTLKTSPQDSTGVAHVLEHTSLCGGEKYPIRDPFFNMLKRSLKTYMNAWTGTNTKLFYIIIFTNIIQGPDYTSYPFSTCNMKDYYNLMSVYLDAVYFPKLDKYDFMQEGHRYEYSVFDDPSTPLEIKGIVFNEMKGAMVKSLS